MVRRGPLSIIRAHTDTHTLDWVYRYRGIKRSRLERYLVVLKNTTYTTHTHTHVHITCTYIFLYRNYYFPPFVYILHMMCIHIYIYIYIHVHKI